MLNSTEMQAMALLFEQHLRSDDTVEDLPPTVRYMVLSGREDGIEMAIAKHPDFGYAVLTGSSHGPVIVWMEKRDWTDEDRLAFSGQRDTWEQRSGDG